DITAGGNLDCNRIVGAGVAVIGCERAPQSSGFDADDCIGLRVEVFAATKRLDGDGVALDVLGVAGQRRLNDEFQKSGKLRRASECGTANDPLQSPAHFAAARLTELVPSKSHDGNPTSASRACRHVTNTSQKRDRSFCA